MRPAIKKGLRWVLTAAIIVFLVMFARTIDWQAAWTSMRQASLPLLGAAIFVNFLSVAVKGVRWWLFLRPITTPHARLCGPNGPPMTAHPTAPNMTARCRDD